MRMAASCCQPLQLLTSPRGARDNLGHCHGPTFTRRREAPARRFSDVPCAILCSWPVRFHSVVPLSAPVGPMAARLVVAARTTRAVARTACGNRLRSVNSERGHEDVPRAQVKRGHGSQEVATRPEAGPFYRPPDACRASHRRGSGKRRDVLEYHGAHHPGGRSNHNARTRDALSVDHRHLGCHGAITDVR